MKKSFLLFLSIGVLFTSCENQLENLPVEEIGPELKTKVVVNFNTTKSLDVEVASNVFNVSIEELKAYMMNDDEYSDYSICELKDVIEITIHNIIKETRR